MKDAPGVPVRREAPNLLVANEGAKGRRVPEDVVVALQHGHEGLGVVMARIEEGSRPAMAEDHRHAAANQPLVERGIPQALLHAGKRMLAAGMRDHR
ncbi:hypothetical protein D3C87_899330 [compost metagenome]